MNFRKASTSILCMSSMVLTTCFIGSTTIYATDTNDSMTPLQNLEESDQEIGKDSELKANMFSLYSDSSATDELSLADLTIPQLSCPTQSTSSSSTQPTATYDNGGPFTTDQYGNVYDR